ncbi:MAG: P1 family peptidase [Chloroflexi bacterium]|nr:P1 family peptidase [Chloroflexota bacterium]
MVLELEPGAITDVGGICVGHWTDLQHLTGCTVVLVEQGAVGGVSVRGLAPGTRETDVLRPGNLVSRVQAVLLTGGSAFGLSAADGVMHYLEQKGSGYHAGSAVVPIVPAAVLYDLDLGPASVRPDAAAGYAACQAASANVPQGNVGAGTGATVGKLFGISRAMKTGIGTASVRAGRLVVGAIVAVNAFGDIYDPTANHIIAGTRAMHAEQLIDTSAALASAPVRTAMALRNTVIGVIATNAKLDSAQVNQVAVAAHDGLARVVRPAHTLFDGDTLFALATGHIRAHQVLVSNMAAEAVQRAILNGVLAAEPVLDLPTARSFAGRS